MVDVYFKIQDSRNEKMLGHMSVRVDLFFRSGGNTKQFVFLGSARKGMWKTQP